MLVIVSASLSTKYLIIMHLIVKIISVLISFMKMAKKNIHQRTFFLWLRRNINELKLISDDKNYNEMYAASSLSRRDFWGLPDIQNTSYRLS